MNFYEGQLIEALCHEGGRMHHQAEVLTWSRHNPDFLCVRWLGRREDAVDSEGDIHRSWVFNPCRG